MTKERKEQVSPIRDSTDRFCVKHIIFVHLIQKSKKDGNTENEKDYFYNRFNFNNFNTLVTKFDKESKGSGNKRWDEVKKIRITRGFLQTYSLHFFLSSTFTLILISKGTQG